MTSALVEGIRTELRAAADPERAPAMAAYMKSTMPYLGVGRPMVRRIARTAARGSGDDLAARVADVRDLWEQATFREERYAAQDLLAIAPARARPELLDLHEHIARSGAWWDHVDEQAHRVAETLDAQPEVATTMRHWSTDESLWVRRLAIIGQLGRKERVDRDLLTDVIEPNLADPEFFIRKAIGWALREFARHDPAWVRTFADSHPLSPLSRREALKHL
jgi:3-methyladenine DNA glycosylase AlkD